MDKKFPITLDNPNIAYNDLESVKFIFLQCEDCLKESQIITDSITNRAYTLISFVIALMVAITGYTANKLNNLGSDLAVNLSCFLSLLYLMLLLYNLKKIVIPTINYRIGSLPEELYTNEIFSKDFSNENRLIFLYMGITEDYRFKIDYVDRKNAERQLSLKKTINKLYILPILFFISCFFLSSLLGLLAHWGYSICLLD